MTQHTPGPWQSSGWTPAGWGDANDKQSVLIFGLGVRIARMYSHNGPPGCNSLAPHDPEVQANARLIAAAPELLAALEGLTHRIASEELRGLVLGPKMREALAEARAVIAKTQEA